MQKLCTTGAFDLFTLSVVDLSDTVEMNTARLYLLMYGLILLKNIGVLPPSVYRNQVYIYIYIIHVYNYRLLHVFGDISAC